VSPTGTGRSFRYGRHGHGRGLAVKPAENTSKPKLLEVPSGSESKGMLANESDLLMRDIGVVCSSVNKGLKISYVALKE
jgi:hypothetical protein